VARSCCEGDQAAEEAVLRDQRHDGEDREGRPRPEEASVCRPEASQTAPTFDGCSVEVASAPAAPSSLG